MARRRLTAAAPLALLAVTAVWGLTLPLVQDAVAGLSVPAFLTWRFGAAALLVGLAAPRRLRGLGREGASAGVGAGALLALGYGLQTTALQHTTAANAGFITGLFVVLVPVLGALVLGRRVAAPVWAAAVAATAGLALLSGVGSGTSHPLGDGLALAGAAAFAAHVLALGRAVERFDVVGLLAVQLATVAALALPVALAADGGLAAPHGAATWLALVVTAVLASALGFLVQSWAQTVLPAERTALVLSAEPAFAGLFAVLLAGDRLTPLAGLGAAIVLAAIVAAELLPRP